MILPSAEPSTRDPVLMNRVTRDDSTSLPLARITTTDGLACRKRSPMFCPRAPAGTASSVAPASRAAAILDAPRRWILDPIIGDDLRSVLAHERCFQNASSIMLLAMPTRNEGLAGPRALVLAVSIAALCGLSPRVSGAVEPDELPWLRRIPDVAAEMTRLPPFFRDTDLRVLLRSYYLKARNANETLSEAWAGGAWLTYRSGWLVDTFQMGATVFSAVPLYAPSDRDGTLLLAPGQEGFIVPGVAYGALRYGDYALLTGYRQIVEQTYVNPHDNRMAPVTYEGVTLGGKVGFADYLVGYLTRQKERNSETFVPIGEAAGVRGNGAGLTLAGVRLRPIQGLDIELSKQIVDDVVNTALRHGEYAYSLDPHI